VLSWSLLLGVVLVLGLSLFATASRRAELMAMAARVRARDRAIRAGTQRAQLEHPVVDLTRCLGCGTCVAACPEDNVLDLVHGQAVVVNGARCKGHGACERECPVSAITVTLGDVSERSDIPSITADLEADGVEGLFLAGEVTAHALVKTAVEHGTQVAAEVGRRTQHLPGPAPGVLDLCIVGAGPAGLACSLEAKRLGLQFETLDQAAAIGGTVAKYPRRKLVMTQPVTLPLYGELTQSTYTKEELIALWQDIATRHALPIRTGEAFIGLERDAEGYFAVRTETGTRLARHVCLALGRRGTPRKLDVIGEELEKVEYGLLDARSYQGRRVLVVGGGDSAVEAALGLAEQEHNEVTLSYRKDAFFRVRAENEARLRRAEADRRLNVLTSSKVLAIHDERVELAVGSGAETQLLTLQNDDVFVMAGGLPPVELLGRSGVSFDQAPTGPAQRVSEQGTGLREALLIGFGLSVLALAFAAWHADYYLLPTAKRPAHLKHDLLRPSQGLGLAFGVASLCLVVVNLAYLLRRSPKVRFQLGSLQTWMTSHVATGILAALFATLHGAMAPRDTVGGNGFWALAVLLVTGAIGRYFYAYVPRAANGRELEVDEVKAQLGKLSASGDAQQRAFGEEARDTVIALIDARQWRGTFFGRVFALLGSRRDLRRVLDELEDRGRSQELPAETVREALRLARSAHRTALAAAHFEDLRAILNSWRYLHRWAAALMVLLVVVHVAYALIYGVSSGGAS